MKNKFSVGDGLEFDDTAGKYQFHHWNRWRTPKETLCRWHWRWLYRLDARPAGRYAGLRAIDAHAPGESTRNPMLSS
ncbi:hypothetical protein KCP76_00315 [Salmonella enterica subsp. enterica serovar Weltevreden]|nr:hypothetical protein KCP76_00315 [Salmonella enterica subsp. enterica serovar Weltevreden]